ncbi:MAG: hypothetical protein PHU85_01720 [Phycisphaerae bacterium]|nr:hypothetical protein [Phycisphaerae bacterium]
MILNGLLLLALVASALATVMTARLLRAAILLAGTSGTLTVIMFLQGAPLAGVFELSVCAGLIPAIFIATIGLTRRLNPEEAAARSRLKLRQYAPLVLIVLLLGALTWHALTTHSAFGYTLPLASTDTDARVVLWSRHADLVGQIVVLTAAAFGVVALVKGGRDE